ncbi:MAG: anti-sigma-factor [Cycloclasticus sp. symbiont of Poecilosclerida sp. N]|nr:MAG: anti-sigma-factor [Cycloclasticus sp. symbiont of Poecilosclerida sp. N]
MDAAQLTKTGSGKIAVSGTLAFGLVIGLLRDSQCFFSGQEPLVFDLSGVKKTDSAGLALLIEWMVLAKESGQTISFQQIPKQMLDIVRLSGLDEILPID